MSEDSDAIVKKERYILIDALRGFAVLLMICFHSAFDLNGFRLINIDIIKDPFWFAFPRFIVSLFLICAGMSLALAHKKGIQWGPFRMRLYKIGACALFITIITYIAFPQNYIYFGILHCIFFTSLVGILFIKKPKLSLILGLLIVIPNMIFQPTLIPVSKWLDIAPFDYVPFYPWFGLLLFGIFLESINFHKVPFKQNYLNKALEFMGKHSLIIYFLHRPVVFGIVFLIYRFKLSDV